MLTKKIIYIFILGNVLILPVKNLKSAEDYRRAESEESRVRNRKSCCNLRNCVYVTLIAFMGAIAGAGGYGYIFVKNNIGQCTGIMGMAREDLSAARQDIQDVRQDCLNASAQAIQVCEALCGDKILLKKGV